MNDIFINYDWTAKYSAPFAGGDAKLCARDLRGFRHV